MQLNCFNCCFVLNSCKHLLPQNFENLILDLDKILEDECKYLPLNCPRTVISKDESLTLIITCSKRSFNNDFYVQVTAHPQGATNVSKQLDLDDLHSLHRSLTLALDLYEAFPEPQLNTQQLKNLEELTEHLDLKFN